MATPADRLLTQEQELHNYNPVNGIRTAPDLSLAASVAAAQNVSGCCLRCRS
jgi:hypothetical protein